MNVLDLVQELNLSPKKAASTNGGEYKARCPQCQDGKDRFCIWPNQGPSGRYWCRVCNCKGDGIQFCRDFLGMTFKEACQRMNVTPKFQRKLNSYNPFPTTKFIPKKAIPLNQRWQNAAKSFIEISHKQLMCNPEALKHLTERGFSLDIIRRFCLGWNPENLFEDREIWGMPQIIKENGYPKRQWLPKGIVIPSYRGNDLNKLKIRRTDWYKKDDLPKYVEVSGSNQSISMYGDNSKPIIIVESELDAMLIQQYASHLVCSIALGGVSKKPDQEIHNIFKKAAIILLSLDYDDPGKRRNAFWMKLYPNIRSWPSPHAKSLGDAVQLFKVDILNWINVGLTTIL